MPSAPSELAATPEMILAGIRDTFASALRPDPELTIGEWSDQYRVLSRVSAGEPGRWRTTRTPFLREIMDCLSPSSPYSRVVYMKPAQIGGSEVLLNMLGYIIHYAPGPTMLVQPTVSSDGPALQPSRGLTGGGEAVLAAATRFVCRKPPCLS